jgi:hypothetical protein
MERSYGILVEQRKEVVIGKWMVTDQVRSEVEMLIPIDATKVEGDEPT